MKILQDFFEKQERFLEQHRKRYEQGHKDELLACLVTCLLSGAPIPAWLRDEFVQAHRAVMTFEKSWNDVFGRPLPKGMQRAKARRELEIAYEICTRVQERHNVKKLNKAGKLKKTPIDKELFAEVGKSLNPKIGGTRVYEIYSKFKDMELYRFKNL